MKKFVKLLTGTVVAGAIFLGGMMFEKSIINEIKEKSQISQVSKQSEKSNNSEAERAKKIAEETNSYNISTIPNGEENIYSQYYTIDSINSDGVTLRNTYFAKDKLEVTLEDLRSIDLKKDTKLIITWNHDSIVAVDYDLRDTVNYVITDSKEYGIDLDNDKYVFGVNPYDAADFTTIEKRNYQLNDLVEVVYEDNNEEIKADKKIGRFNSDK